MIRFQTQWARVNALKITSKEQMNKQTKETRKNTAYFHFYGWPTLGRTGICVGSYDPNGLTRGYLMLKDSGVEVYLRGTKQPTRTLKWQEAIQKLLT